MKRIVAVYRYSITSMLATLFQRLSVIFILVEVLVVHNAQLTWKSTSLYLQFHHKIPVLTVSIGTLICVNRIGPSG